MKTLDAFRFYFSDGKLMSNKLHLFLFDTIMKKVEL